MITLAQSTADVIQAASGSAIGCQIASAAAAYGLNCDFLQFWQAPGAVYSKMDGIMRIAGTVQDPEEARLFLQVIGAAEILCTPDVAKKLRLTILEEGLVLQKDGVCAGVQQDNVSPLRMIPVLQENRMLQDADGFYLDLSHRTRHGAAITGEICTEGKTVACGAAVFTPQAALLTAIAVLPVHQRQGLGRRMVQALEERLGQRKLYLLCTAENEAFYTRLGYHTTGRWCSAIQK